MDSYFSPIGKHVREGKKKGSWPWGIATKSQEVDFTSSEATFQMAAPWRYLTQPRRTAFFREDDFGGVCVTKRRAPNQTFDNTRDYAQVSGRPQKANRRLKNDRNWGLRGISTTTEEREREDKSAL